MNILIIILCFGVLIKNLDRIYKNYSLIYTDYPWPKKNSSKILNTKVRLKSIQKGGQFLYYKPINDLCYYSKSPCTHLVLDKPIIKSKVFNFYDIFVVDYGS